MEEAESRDRAIEKEAPRPRIGRRRDDPNFRAKGIQVSIANIDRRVQVLLEQRAALVRALAHFGGHAPQARTDGPDEGRAPLGGRPQAVIWQEGR